MPARHDAVFAIAPLRYAGTIHARFATCRAVTFTLIELRFTPLLLFASAYA